MRRGLAFRAPAAWCAAPNTMRCIARGAGGRAANSPFFSAPMAWSVSRFGWSIKKALGTAVRRNRIRRRLREILRLHRQEIAPGWDIVIHPRSSAATAEFSASDAGAAEADSRASPANRDRRNRRGRILGSTNSCCGLGSASAGLASTSLFLSPFSGAPASFIRPARTTRTKPSRATARAAASCSALKRLGRCRPFTRADSIPCLDRVELASAADGMSASAESMRSERNVGPDPRNYFRYPGRGGHFLSGRTFYQPPFRRRRNPSSDSPQKSAPAPIPSRRRAASAPPRQRRKHRRRRR